MYYFILSFLLLIGCASDLVEPEVSTSGWLSSAVQELKADVPQFWASAEYTDQWDKIATAEQLRPWESEGIERIDWYVRELAIYLNPAATAGSNVPLSQEEAEAMVRKQIEQSFE